MKFLDNVKFDQINPNNLSAKFLKVREYFLRKTKISVFAGELSNYKPGLISTEKMKHSKKGKTELWPIIRMR